MERQRMTKRRFLDHWRELAQPENGIPPLEMRPVPYKHRGSCFDQDGIRITGSAGFIDAVLVRLADLLRYEAATTRLQTAYQQVVDRQTGLPVPDAFCCYVQVHQRGREGALAQALVDGHA